MKHPPAHTPRHPLQDSLYWHIARYRDCKVVGSTWTAKYRRAALAMIAQIKGRAQ